MGNVIKSQIVARDTKNILNYTTWVAGNTEATGFSRNGLSNENLLLNGLDPWGNETVLWLATPGGDGNADGGWNTSNFSVDKTKLYRFSVWVKRTVYVNGAFYLGLNGFGTTNGVLNRSTGANNTNPYFWVSSDPPTTAQLPDSTWVLVVGHVWPEGSGTGSNNSNSGLYTITSGKYGSISVDYVWNTSTSARHRSYLYYSESNLPRQYWCYPRVDIVDGTEPTIAQLLGGYGALTTSALEKSNFLLGPSDTTSYFTTSDGGYYNAIIPPSGGYTIYAGEPATAGAVAKAPAIFTSQNDTTLVTDAQNIFKTSFSSASNVLSWAAPQNNILIVNREYEPIVTSGLVLNLDAGFTPSYPKEGTPFYDISGNGFNGTLTNSPSFDSSNGGIIVYDGVDDYVVIPHNTSLNLYPITLASWVNVSSGGDIINKYYSGSTNGYRVRVTTSGVSVYYFQSGFTNYTTNYDSVSGTILSNTWYYITVTVNSGGVTIYINGNSVGTRSWVGTPGAPTTAQDVSIGVYPGTSNNYFSGKISSSQIYNRALTTQEILQNYNATKSRFGL